LDAITAVIVAALGVVSVVAVVPWFLCRVMWLRHADEC
jgi:hypothetical protein